MPMAFNAYVCCWPVACACILGYQCTLPPPLTPSMRAGSPAMVEATIIGTASINDTVGEAINIALLHVGEGTRTRCHLLLRQTCKLFGISLQTINTAVMRAYMPGSSALSGGSDPRRSVGPATRAKLVETGDCGASGKPPLCCPVSSVCRALKHWHQDPQVVESLAKLGVDGPPWKAQHDSLQLEMQPATLPDAAPPTGPPRQLSLASSHPQAAAHGLLTYQLQELREFYSKRVVDGRVGHSLCPDSLDRLKLHVLMFLGYCKQMLGEDLPNMACCTKQVFLAKYLRARMQNDTSCRTISNDMKDLKRAVLWWRRQDAGRPYSAELEEVVLWLKQLSNQMWSSHLRPAPVVVSVQAGDVLRALLATRAKVLRVCRDRMTADSARQLHDLALFSMMFAYLAPLRSVCVRTLFTPGAPAGCGDPRCSRKGCKGNRLEIRSGGSLALILSHYKTARKYGVVDVVLPEELAEVIRLLLDKGLRLLKPAPAPGHAFLFRGILGQAFTGPCFSLYFKRMVVKCGAPKVSAHALRTIFVTDRVAPQAFEGPSVQESAACMTNSPQAWDMYYNQHGLSNLAQQGIDKMAAWRAAHLGAPPPDLQDEMDGDSDEE